MQTEGTSKTENRQNDGFPCHCLKCGRGMDFDLIWCSICWPSRPDRLPVVPRKIETPIDNRALRGHLRTVGRRHLELAAYERRESLHKFRRRPNDLELAACERRRITRRQMYLILLNAARHIHSLVQEFKIAADYPQWTDGTPDELRERLYTLVAEEAYRVMVESEHEGGCAQA